MPNRNDTMLARNTLVVEECINCGILFAFSDGLRQELMGSHRNFYCPNGHSQQYIDKTDLEKVREQLSASERRVEYNRQRAQQAIRSRNAMKGQVTKIKNRVGKGVCPCCNRSFPQLSAHMESEHPEFTDA